MARLDQCFRPNHTGFNIYFIVITYTLDFGYLIMNTVLYFKRRSNRIGMALDLAIISARYTHCLDT